MAAHRYYEEEGSAALAPAAAVLDELKTPYERFMKFGDPAEAIATFAAEWNADLLTIGRHRHSAVATLPMGSVAQKVMATATAPVLFP